MTGPVLNVSDFDISTSGSMQDDDFAAPAEHRRSLQAVIPPPPPPLPPGIKKAEPWALQAEFAWSLATHMATYPNDPMEMAVQVALDDWDLDGPPSEGDAQENDYLG